MPAWAYQDVLKLDNFNITEAQALDSTNPPESTGGSGPTASASGAIPTSSDLSDGDPGNVQGSTSKKSNAGAIAGGVVGGVVGLLLIAGAAWWFLKRRQPKRSVPATSPYQLNTDQGHWDDKQQQALLGGASPNQQIYAPQPVSGQQPLGAKLYVSTSDVRPTSLHNH